MKAFLRRPNNNNSNIRICNFLYPAEKS